MNIRNHRRLGIFFAFIFLCYTQTGFATEKPTPIDKTPAIDVTFDVHPSPYNKTFIMNSVKISASSVKLNDEKQSFNEWISIFHCPKIVSSKQLIHGFKAYAGYSAYNCPMEFKPVNNELTATIMLDDLYKSVAKLGLPKLGLMFSSSDPRVDCRVHLKDGTDVNCWNLLFKNDLQDQKLVKVTFNIKDQSSIKLASPAMISTTPSKQIENINLCQRYYQDYYTGGAYFQVSLKTVKKSQLYRSCQCLEDTTKTNPIFQEATLKQCLMNLSYSNQILKHTILLQRQSLNGCFISLLDREPYDWGIFPVKFKINQSGSVQNIEVLKREGPMYVYENQFNQCVVNEISKWHFLSGQNEMNITALFRFTPNHLVSGTLGDEYQIESN